MITTRTHAVIDYAVGILLIAAPFILGFATGGPEQWVPMVLGAATIVYSLLTRYEFSVVKAIPYRTHLVIDAVAGLFLLASPWLLGYAEVIWWPHVLVGILELIVVAMSWGTVDRVTVS